MSKCPPFPIVPGVSVCPGACELLSLCKLPRRYPKTTALASLQTEYSFTEDLDFHTALDLRPEAYAIPNSDTRDIEADPTLGHCDEEDLQNASVFYSYIAPVLQQENGRVGYPWILSYNTGLVCEGQMSGIRKGPAYISMYNTIQEMLVPPIVTPFVPRRSPTNPGTILGPSGSCDGTWVLSWVGGALQWVCEETSSGAPFDCSKLQITSVSISGGDTLYASELEDTTFTCNVTVRYSGSAPIPGMLLTLNVGSSSSALFSPAWTATGNSAITVMIGPHEGSSSGVTFNESAQFTVSGTECYSTEGEDKEAATIFCTAAIVNCGLQERSSNDITVFCDPSTDQLTAELVVSGGTGDDGTSFGEFCGDIEEGSVFVELTLTNTTDMVYINPNQGAGGIRLISITGETDGVSVTGAGIENLPDRLEPGESVIYSYDLPFFLTKDTVCGGSFNVAANSAFNGAESITVTINGGCTECPTYEIEEVTWVDGDVTETFDTKCASTTSWSNIIKVKIKSSDEEAPYLNKTDDTIGIEPSTYGGLGFTVTVPKDRRVPDIDAGSTVTLEFPVSIQIQRDVQLGDADGLNINFDVVDSESVAGGSVDVTIKKDCGPIRADIISTTVGGATAPGTTELEMCGGTVSGSFKVEITNTSTEHVFYGDLVVAFHMSGSGDVLVFQQDIGEYLFDYMLDPGGSVELASPTFTAFQKTDGDGAITSSVTLTINGKDKVQAEGHTIDIICPSSSSSSSSSESSSSSPSSSSSSSLNICGNLIAGEGLEVSETADGMCSIRILDEYINKLISDWIAKNSTTCED